MEINKIVKKKKKPVQKISKTKGCFFKKINEIDKKKTFTRLNQLKKKTQISKIRNESGVATDTPEIQRIIRKYYKYLYANKSDNLNKRVKFLQTYT